MENLKNFIADQIKNSYETKLAILQDNKLINLIVEVAQKAAEVYKNGHKILIAGNGGSAADAQHIAGELVSRFYFDRPALPAMALTTDTSIMTAISNDFGYEQVFSRQVQASGVKGDMLIAISTSGNSPNIIRAVEEAQKMDIVTVGLVGEKACAMDQLCDYCIKIPSKITPRIQESHIMIGHIICSVVEEELFGKDFKPVTNIVKASEAIIIESKRED